MIEGLSFRHIAVVRGQYAVSHDGMKLFGVRDLETMFADADFRSASGTRTTRTMRLSMTVGYRVLVCDNMAFWGGFTPVLAKHTKNFQIEDAYWWAVLVSNQRPPACKADALPLS